MDHSETGDAHPRLYDPPIIEPDGSRSRRWLDLAESRPSAYTLIDRRSRRGEEPRNPNSLPPLSPKRSEPWFSHLMDCLAPSGHFAGNKESGFKSSPIKISEGERAADL